MRNERRPGESVSTFYWRYQPLWMKPLTFYVLLPVWFALLALIVTGKAFEWIELTMVLGAVFAAIAVMQNFYLLRSIWKPEGFSG